MFVLFGKGLVGLFQLKIILYIIVPFAHTAGKFARYVHKSSLVKLIVGKKKVKRDYLQHQEEKKIGKLSDEEKNISHRWKFEVKAAAARRCLMYYLITKG